MNKKGFTFVELLATITILGLLMITVLVSYNNYLKNAKKRYMKAQEDTVTLSGKEFFTDYRSDLPQTIGDKENVTITELNSKKYLSKLTDYNGKQCVPSNDTNYNKVYAYKVMDGVYLYYTLLDCNGYKTNEDHKGPTITFNPNKADINKDLNVIMTAKDNKKVAYYSYEIEKDGIVISSESYKPYNGSVTITLKDEGTYVITGHAIDSSGNVTNKKSGKYVIDKTVPDCSKIQISSTNGSRPGVWQAKDVILKIMPHSDIDKWSINSCIMLKSNGSACSRIGSNLVGTETKTLKGVYDSSLSNNKGRENGQVYALITAYDAVGNSCNIRTDSYLIDKDSPTINSSSIRSRTSSFNSLKTIINLSISDRGDSNNKIYYRIYDSLKGNSAWTEYVPVTATVGVRFNYDLAGNYDGGVRTIYIRAKDELGNISDKKKITYTVYKACDNKISNTTTGTCSASTGFGQATITTTYTDKFFSSISCGTTTSQTTCCVAPAVSYSDWGSCSRSCGGGLQYRIKTTTACDGTVTKTQESQACNSHDCCSSVYYTDSSECSKSCGGGTKKQIAHSNYNGQLCPNQNKNSGGAACNTKACPVRLVKSAHICPEDQLKPTREECEQTINDQKVYNYNTLVVTNVWVSGYKIRVKGYLRNNASEHTYNANDSKRTVCIAGANNVCVKNLCSFSIENKNYAKLGEKFCEFDSGAGATSTKKWAAGKYRVIVKNTSGLSDKWRFETTPYMVDLFEVK